MSQDYRNKVGPPWLFDIVGAQQFCVLVNLGLREHHTVLDFGCGCLRGGRFLINYLLPGRYTGIDPDIDLVAQGVKMELTHEVAGKKNPRFYHWDDFRFADRLPHTFNIVLAQSIITHAGPDLVERLFRNAHEVLSPHGLFVGTMFVGQKDEPANGWHGDDAVAYDWKRIRKLAYDTGFESFTEPLAEHPMGQTWFVARKRFVQT